MYVSWFLFLSLSLCTNVCTRVKLHYDSLYVHILLFFALVILFLSGYTYSYIRIYCDSFLRVDIRLLIRILSVFPLDASVSFQLYCHGLSRVQLIVYIYVRLYWLYVYRYFSYSAFLSVFLSLCLCQCPGYIIGNLHVCEQARSARSVCNRALETVCNSIVNSAYIPTSLRSYFWLYVHIRRLIVFIFLFLSEYL